MGSIRKRLRPRKLGMYVLALGALWFARPALASIVLGIVPIVLGEGLRLWATGHLHKNDDLTVTGPYAYVRHPLYLGTLLIASGFAIMGGNLLSLTLFVAFVVGYFAYYMPYKNRIEGARLEELYGDAYRRFEVAVPRLIPRLNPYRPLDGDQKSPDVWRGERFADNNEVGTAAAVAIGVVAMVGRWVLL